MYRSRQCSGLRAEPACVLRTACSCSGQCWLVQLQKAGVDRDVLGLAGVRDIREGFLDRGQNLPLKGQARLPCRVRHLDQESRAGKHWNEFRFSLEPVGKDLGAVKSHP